MLDGALAGNLSFEIRFRYYDPNTGDFDWYVQIDDVLVTYCELAPPPIPTLSEWGMIVLLLTFMIFGTLGVRLFLSNTRTVKP
jgi:hypothetical protein